MISASMVAVGAEVSGSWLSSSGPVVAFFVVLLLLSIFLTALCGDCRRYSFELRDSEADSSPSSLVRVVKLEEAVGARVNPAIGEIRSDEAEKTLVTENPASFTPWRSHLGAPQRRRDLQTNGGGAVNTTIESNAAAENSVPFTPWRSHFRAPQSQDPNSSTPPDSAHIYQEVGEGRSIDNSFPLSTNQEPGSESGAQDKNSLYAQVSKRAGPTMPPPLPQVEG